MPFNGSGGFISLNPPDFPAVANTIALAATFNNSFNDVFLGLGNCVTRDGQSPATANIPMGGFKHTGVAAGTATGQYLAYGQTTGFPIGGAMLSTYAFNSSPNIQSNWTGANSSFGGSLFAATTGGAVIELAKSRGTTVGSYTIAVQGDTMGAIMFSGADGTDFALGASISAEVDSTPGNNDMPGRLLFKTTPDGSATPVEAFRLTSDKTAMFDGRVQFKNTAQAFASNPTLNFSQTDFITFGTLTGNVSSTALTGLGVGSVGTVFVTQDGTGGRTFGFAGSPKIAGSVGTLANQMSVATIMWNGSSHLISWTVYA